MYYFFIVINSLAILFISYLLVFEPNQLATGVNERAILLTITSLLAFILLTGLSVYFKSVKQMTGVSSILLAFSWILIVVFFLIFLAKQKWM